MTTLDSYICETQGEIFELAACKGLDMEVFAKEYMHSDFCIRQFDTLYSRYQLADAKECWDFIWPELCGKVSKGEVCEHDYVSNWVGYTYRQIYILSGVPSPEIYDKLPLGKMVMLYPGYHTIDEDMAGERLCESCGLTL